MENNKLISIIIPVYNEAENITKLFFEIEKITKTLKYTFEYIFVNDGSTDSSEALMSKLAETHKNVTLLNFSRNFGKEMATTAGINNCKGVACIIIDADLQHPPKYIKDFLFKWEEGADIVVGVRNSNEGEGLIKKYGSILFYKIINGMGDTKMIPSSTDFRLLDRTVINEFNKLAEHNRITRGLIDWLGFKRDIIFYDAARRTGGKAGYDFFKLTKLAFNGIVSLSIFPLRLAGYLGIFITLFSGIIGLIVFISKYFFKTDWGTSISGTAILAIILMFLIGIVLISLGLIALYIANIYSEVNNRPLYILKRRR